VQEPTVHQFTPQVGYQTYAVREPVLRVHPGDRVVTETLWGEWMEEEGGAWPGEVGPIYVEGATPADTLVVRILRLQPNAEYAVARHIPGFAALGYDIRTPVLYDPLPAKTWIWRLDHDRNVGILDLPNSRLGRIEIPLEPMLGRVAVAPAGDEQFAGLWPGDFGGNMDAADVTAGATVYLPIFHEGAYFYFGDVHARQGDGEISGTGLETSAEVTFEFDLIKDQTIAWPRLENDTHIMVLGSVRPLQDAMRIAYVELVRWLEADYGFDLWEAYQVVSQVGTVRVANIVDPNYTVVARFPKSLLPR
jgi:acetamidase/formamidase